MIAGMDPATMQQLIARAGGGGKGGGASQGMPGGKGGGGAGEPPAMPQPGGMRAGGLLGGYGGPQLVNPTSYYQQQDFNRMPAPFYQPFTPSAQMGQGGGPQSGRYIPGGGSPATQQPGAMQQPLPPFADQHMAFFENIPGLLEAYGKNEPWATNLVRNPGILGSMGGE